MGAQREHRARIGGLMRCCLERIQHRADQGPPAEGERMLCSCGDVIRYREGAWEWEREMGGEPEGGE